MLVSLLLVLSLFGYGCSSKTQVYDVGENITDFNTDISVYTELNQKNLILRVDNPKGIDYRLWVTYNNDCPKKKYSSRTEVYAGNEKQQSILIDVPKNEKDCKQRIGVRVRDTKGEIIYSSPTLTTFQIGEMQ
jgi:hypothetical protein